MRRRQAIGLAGAAALLPWTGRARAAADPRAVSLIVPDFPAAPAGVAARVLWGPLADALGRPVVLDFRPGAGGIAGLMAGARARRRAAPDPADPGTGRRALARRADGQHPGGFRADRADQLHARGAAGRRTRPVAPAGDRKSVV